MEIVKCNNGDFEFYRVGKDDNLTTIMAKFEVGANSIIRNNPAVDFYEGEVVKILIQCNTIHTVKPLETLDGIASTYNTTSDNLVNFNDLQSKRVFIGQKLIVAKAKSNKKSFDNTNIL